MDQQTGMPTPAVASNKKPWIIGGTIVVLAIVAFAMFNRSNLIDEKDMPLAGDENILVVRDQDPDAVAALIEFASVKEPAYIIIHEDLAGVPGPIAAHSALLQPGAHRNVSVIMQLKPGAIYHAMLHADDGNGLFDAAIDKRHLMDNAGKEVITMFRVRLSSTPGDIKG